MSDNCVKQRQNGGGDDFANAHRSAQTFLYCSDIDDRVEMWQYDNDVVHAAVNGEDRTFFEYAIHGCDEMPRCAIVALFDRKKQTASMSIANVYAMRSRHPFFNLC